MAERGRYIVWEGSDGIGKSTQMRIAVEESKQRGIPTLATYEPGGSSIGPDVRKILLDPKSGDIHLMAESHLFLADRVQLWHGTVAVALAEGFDVHSDRNWWSSLAYQGAGGKISMDTIIQQHQLSLPPEYLIPDLGFVFYMTEEERLAREALASTEEFGTRDRMEQKRDGFFGRVEEGYRYVRENLGAISVHAAGSIDVVSDRWRPYLL